MMMMVNAEEPGDDAAAATPNAEQAEAAARPELRVELEYAERVNFAMHQHGVPLIELMSLTNDGHATAMDVSVTISLENGECEPWTARLEMIGAGETVRLTPEAAAFSLRGRDLAQRAEAERTTFLVEVACSDQQVSSRWPVDLLAFDQWPGITLYPDLLAAFITPNHDAMVDLLRAARASLGELSEHDAIDGYQSGSRLRASLIAEAGFNAVAMREIGYIGVPASFEKQGQRIRLVDRVLRENFGNCLDLSLLLAGIWEQSGLHPMVLFTEGHAMPAVWMHASHLPEPVGDDPARIRNLIELGELVALEATMLCQRGANFADAVNAARMRLNAPGAMFCAVDVRCCRKRGVRPLPLRFDPEGTTLDLEALEKQTVTAAGTTLDRIAVAERLQRAGADAASTLAMTTEESGDDRIRRWQKRLLDLSLRNRLINFRETKGTVRLNVPDIALLEDLLASEVRFSLNAKAEGDASFVGQQIESHHLYTTLPAAETADRLLKLYRTARLSIEETGANMLHLALGMLKWYETPTSEQPRHAPLILLPIRLVRQATGSGYRYELALSDEPLRPNITLLEKLRADFGIDTTNLAELPEDERGIDVQAIVHRFRDTIRNIARWEVEETAYIGLFSFNKFLMWRDLQEHLDQLRQNRLVRHLIDRDAEAFENDTVPVAESMDDVVVPGELLCTRDADSTQLAAIHSAAMNRTFVLEGPPGTGKSQTIANIMADSIGRGKRVLFVAEKLAALSVVSKRLADDGLAPFCLELHSAKASKKEVLVQLQAGLDHAAATPPLDWDALCTELGTTREQLNRYVQELHQARPSGESLYAVLGRLSSLGDGPRCDVPTSDVASTSADELAAWRNGIVGLVDASEAIDPAHEHPLRGLRRTEWSFSLPAEAQEVLDAARKACDTLHQTGAMFLSSIAAEVVDGTTVLSSASMDGVQALLRVAALLPESPLPDRRLLADREAREMVSDLRGLCDLGRRRDRLRDELQGRYRAEFLELDHLAQHDTVTRAMKQPAIVRPFVSFLARRSLRPYCVGGVPSLETLAIDLDTAREVRRATLELQSATEAAHVFGRRWKNGDAEWETLESILAWCEQFQKLTDELKRERLPSALIDAIVAAASDDDCVKACRSTAQDFLSAWKQWRAAWERLEKSLEAVISSDSGKQEHNGWIPTVQDALARWRSAIPALNDWCTWNRARHHGLSVGLDDLVQQYEQGTLQRHQLQETFERSYAERWFNAVADSVDAVRQFNSSSHQKTIERFRTLDQALIRKTREVIVSRLRKELPSGRGQVSAQSELGILRRELEKKSRHLPTRQLISAMPNLLPRLKPCFLMSPLSVAQFLDASLPPFDLVIFDEASQIPVWDSIGAIARGAEVIVVGDSRQLPPTTFFGTLENDDDPTREEIEVEDMESILKECNASGVPALWLKWHYRSQHESLISFSNHHYYRNELHTFPSPQDRSPELGVTFHYVREGLYDRGGSRTNRIEANRVVEQLITLLTASECPDSCGIVTFNQAQQTLIEDMLDLKRRELPEIERFFTNEVDEPVFVKNLENVQGDERDTIMFSIGYGPDEHGWVSMNFGPLNQDGGERRLNVAITRAKKRLMVFSSLRSDQIDLKRTRSIGVRHFKQFLDYADRGPRSLIEAEAAGNERRDVAALEKAVGTALTERGWDVEMHYGCAGYRIDLAVRDPERPGRSLLGIECDGHAYHSARSARDRDRLRDSVLRNLGWNLERIWSIDWRMNSAHCIDRLEQRLAAIQQLSRQSIVPESDSSPDSGEVRETVVAAIESPAPATGVGDEDAGSDEQPLEGCTSLPVYRRAAPTDSVTTQIDFYDSAATHELADALEAIVRTEGPIVEALAMRRLADWFNVMRLTDRSRARFAEVRDLAIRRGAIAVSDDSLWPPDLDPAMYTTYRTPGTDDADQRDLEHIPLIERINVVVHVVHQQFGLPREELEREAARTLGQARITARVKELIGEAIDTAIDRQLIQADGERICRP